jgi:hypothetical protein
MLVLKHVPTTRNARGANVTIAESLATWLGFALKNVN